MPKYETLFSEFLAPHQIITDHQKIEPFLQEWRGRFRGHTDIILQPQTTEEVSKIVKICSENSISIVPQGGNTGLVGGQIPDSTGKSIILSLQKMNKIIDISPQDSAVTCQSGVILETLHNTLEAHNMILPLRLASEGSAQIGGLISTNAGGTSVLKYGNMRDLILGIEAVMPNGDIVNDLHYLRKANRGFDIKSLFSGTEGTMGILTAASLKLFNKPKTLLTGMISCENIHNVIDIFRFLKENFSHELSECELIPEIGFAFVEKHKSIKCPFETAPAWAILFEISSHYPDDVIMAYAENTLSKLLETSPRNDVILAQSEHQKNELQKIRMLLSECQKYEGASIKHDISVPIKNIPDMIQRGCAAAKDILSDIRPVPFGHIGDGNLHFNFSQPRHMTKEEFMALETILNEKIFEIVYALDGSFSAEHGIGQLRREQLKRYLSPEHYRTKKILKKAFDPNNLINPNKLLF